MQSLVASLNSQQVSTTSILSAGPGFEGKDKAGTERHVNDEHAILITI